MENLKSKEKLWFYWEGEIPDYIKMCWNTAKENVKSCDIVLVTPENVSNYIEKEDYELYCHMRNFNAKNDPGQRADFLRICLLQKNGGIWADSDIIFVKDVDLVLEKLKNYDLVVYEQPSLAKDSEEYYKSIKSTLEEDGRFLPENFHFIAQNFFASKKEGFCITKMREEARKVVKNKPYLNNIRWGELGSEII